MPIKKETGFERVVAGRINFATKATGERNADARSGIRGLGDALVLSGKMGAALKDLKTGTLNQRNQQAAAIITAASAHLSNNISTQVLSASNLVTAFAPAFAKNFAASSIGSGIIAGLQGMGIGDIAGKITKDPILGAITGATASGAVASAMGVGAALGPIAAILGGIFGFLSGGSARRKRIDAKKKLARQIEEQNEILGEGLQAIAFQADEIGRTRQELSRARVEIAAGLKDAEEIANTNFQILNENESEIKRIGALKTDIIQRATKEFVGRQKVTFSTSGFGRMSFSDWVVIGDTETMGLSQEQEARFELEAGIKNVNYQRQGVQRSLDAYRREADYANFKIGLNEKAVDASEKEMKLQAKTLVRKIGSNIDILREKAYDYAKTDKMARAKTMMNFGAMLGSDNSKSSGEFARKILTW